MIDFDAVQTSLDRLFASTDASEAHGTLCGLLLGQQDFSIWMDYTLNNRPDQNDLLANERMEVLKELFDLTRTQLNADDISLELLLADEDVDFSVRLTGLASWCQGFLYGLAVNGEAHINPLSEQGRECLDDLIQISQIRHDEEQEDSETVFAEIVEHVRLSVIYMNEEINPVLPASQIQ